jgi:hypothetical protein
MSQIQIYAAQKTERKLWPQKKKKSSEKNKYARRQRRKGLKRGREKKFRIVVDARIWPSKENKCCTTTTPTINNKQQNLLAADCDILFKRFASAKLPPPILRTEIKSRLRKSKKENID